MSRKLMFALTVVVLVASVPAIAFASGPADKGTGSITLYEPWDDGYREVSFAAHAEMDGRPARGYMVDNVYGPGPDGPLRRVFEYDVYYVNVSGDYVFFGALCTYDSNGTHIGRWLYVKAYDGGTPGTAGDHLGWKWGSQAQVAGWVASGTEPPGWWRPAIAGNLQVHTYD